jgi:GTPase SAR1 family protein
MGIMDGVYIKRICPNCNEEFYPGDCDIVSTAIDSTTNTHKVLRFAAKGGLKQRLARINPDPINKKLVLELGHRKCIHCGYLLPSNIELVDNINIAIVGDTSSGKSHYIAALIHQIQQGELQRADRYARFDCMTQDVERIYIQEVIKPLFEDKQSPPPTPPAIGKNRPPLIYELIINPSPEHPSRRINLILYDVSGEDLADKERMVRFSRYVFNATAIIFLADPTSMSQIYNLLPAFLQKKAATGRRPSSVLNSVMRLIEDYRGYDSGAHFSSMPIAITVTKSDLLKQLTTIQQQYHFLKKPVYNGTINLQDLDAVDREVRQLLEEYGERTLLQSTLNFSKVRFFATSATGYAPDKNGIYPAIDPCRCLDPILWILYQLDILHVV